MAPLAQKRIALFPPNAWLEHPRRLWKPDRKRIEPWGTGNSVRRAFQKSCRAAGLPYFNPHSVRHLLAELANQMCRSERERAAWSHNFGHESLGITRSHYAKMTDEIRDEILSQLATKPSNDVEELEMMLRLHAHCYQRDTPEHERASKLWEDWQKTV
ncbi:MAG: hypothetical protein WDZ83_09890 [Rhizobiaceae bacterium]